MQCQTCHTESSATAKFCAECGTGLARACPHCGHEVGPRAKFCAECGQALATARAVAEHREHRASPHEYTPPHLAERILAARSTLEGERKHVTVLFADLKSSTELVQGLDAEDAQGLLDGAVKAMMEAVHRYEGAVNHILGDGIMALFGAPLAHEDHAVRACYAALAMQERVRRYAEETLRRYGVAVRIRVGLNSGEVVVRAIANDLRMDYSAMGPTVHLAARMEQTAPEGGTLLTAGTLRLVEGYIEVTPLGGVPVKGFAEPVEVFELVGATTTRTRLQVSAARGLTRFVGRQAEMDALQRALALADAGRGQIVAPVGEPGVGKSRLYWEFTHSHRTKGWLVLESGSVSYGKATSYLPVIDLWKTYCRIDARDDARAIREKVTGKLLTLDPALGSTLPALLALLDVDVEDPAWQALDPSRRRQQTLEAVKHVLLRESQEQPLVLVFEDLHWIDSETQALLDGLVDSLPTARILLLVNYRPEYAHTWWNKTYYTQLRLDPLPQESADELLQALIGDDPALDPLRRMLIAQTEGNPFFLEESVRSLAETGVLVGVRGAYRPTRALATIEVPSTVQSMLAARIDRLSPDDKRLLQSAAVIGNDVPFALLQAIADRSEGELRASLARLQTAEFLYEASLFPELEYTFKHALTHDVAYGGLLQERRRVLHARIVDAIEGLHADRPDEQVERLAKHAVRGEVWEKALAYCRQAGLRALGRSVHREAVAAFEEALLALEHLPETRERQEQAIDIRLDFPRSLIPLGEIERLLDRLGEAETTAEQVGDRVRLGRIAAFQTGGRWFLGQSDHAVQTGQRALALAEATGDTASRVVGGYFQGLARVASGDHRRGVDLLESTVAMLTGDLVRERFGGGGYPSSIARAWLAGCLAELGEFAEAISYGQEAIRIAKDLDHPYSLTLGYLELGVVYLRKGEPEQAIPVLERGRELCQTWDIPFLDAGVAARLGLAYTLVGRSDEALPLLEQAGAQVTDQKRVTYPARARTAAVVAEAYLRTGRSDGALGELALTNARAHKNTAHEAWLLRLLGETAARRDPLELESAEASLGQALALAEQLGLRPLEARCHLDLGTLYRRAGRPDEARAELSTSATMFREMEMMSWLPACDAEFAELAAEPRTRAA
jgi:class 3 adenylate cyclase